MCVCPVRMARMRATAVSAAAGRSQQLGFKGRGHDWLPCKDECIAKHQSKMNSCVYGVLYVFVVDLCSLVFAAASRFPERVVDGGAKHVGGRASKGIGRQGVVLKHTSPSQKEPIPVVLYPYL